MAAKLHVYMYGIGGRYPAICDHRLAGSAMQVFFAARVENRCQSCIRALERRGYSIKALEKRYKPKFDLHMSLY